MLFERLRERLSAGMGFVEPCLPSPAKKPPAGSNWIHEIKHDGYRLMARRNPAGVRLFTSPGSMARSSLATKMGSPYSTGCATGKDEKSYAMLVAFDLLELDGADDDALGGGP